MCLVIRFYLHCENRRRQQLLTELDSDSDRHKFINTGNDVVKISVQDLDKTDRENLKFKYPL